jgi:hypothetical protein
LHCLHYKLGLSCAGGWLRQHYQWPCQLMVLLLPLLLLRVLDCGSALLLRTCAVLRQVLCVWHQQRRLLLLWWPQLLLMHAWAWVAQLLWMAGCWQHQHHGRCLQLPLLLIVAKRLLPHLLLA